MSKEQIKEIVDLVHGKGNYQVVNDSCEYHDKIKEDTRAERDKEIIDLIRNNIAPDTHEQERLIEEIIEMIEGNK